MLPLPLRSEVRCTRRQTHAWLLALTLLAPLGCTSTEDEMLTEAGAADGVAIGARAGDANAQDGLPALDAAGKAVAFLESDPQVFRYAWFIGRSSQPAAIDLFAPSATLTPLGSAYVASPGTCR